MTSLRSTSFVRGKGFTLLELLVVIGIVSILISLLAVSFAAIQTRSRDARRREDMKAIQDSLEQYYANNSFVYPADTVSCKAAISSYIKQSLPIDPKTGDDYSITCIGVSYCICSTLEAGNGNALAEDCSSWGDGDFYCVGSLQ